jgi:hypothetical protein
MRCLDIEDGDHLEMMSWWDSLEPPGNIPDVTVKIWPPPNESILDLDTVKEWALWPTLSDPPIVIV